VTAPQQLKMFPTVSRLRRTDPKWVVRRFYLVTVQPDLFGGAALVAESGQVGSPGSTTTRQTGFGRGAITQILACFSPNMPGKRASRKRQSTWNTRNPCFI
jgi:predicted DNA-binding WGR domain protein